MAAGRGVSRTLRRGALLALLVAASAGPSFAGSIGPDCGSCFGSIYSLVYLNNPISSTSTTQTFQVTLTIDTTHSNATVGSAGDFIDAVGIKVSSKGLGQSLVSAPGGVSKWTLTPGGVDAKGCDSVGSGFECAEDTSTVAPLPYNGDYVWVFDVTVPKGTLALGSNGASVRALYTTDVVVKGKLTEKQLGLTSEDVTLTSQPEPGGLALLGTALLGAAVFLRRTLAPSR